MLWSTLNLHWSNYAQDWTNLPINIQILWLVIENFAYRCSSKVVDRQWYCWAMDVRTVIVKLLFCSMSMLSNLGYMFVSIVFNLTIIFVTWLTDCSLAGLQVAQTTSWKTTSSPFQQKPRRVGKLQIIDTLCVLFYWLVTTQLALIVLYNIFIPIALPRNVLKL